MLKVTAEGEYQLQTPKEQVLFSVRGPHYIKRVFQQSKQPNHLVQRPLSATPIRKKKSNDNKSRPKTAGKRRAVQSDGLPSIFKAAQSLDIDRIRELLYTNRAKSSDRNKYLLTPLHYVVRESIKHKNDVLIQTKCVRIGALLLQWGANMHSENNVGVSPISSAAYESPVMSALFRRYIGKHGDKSSWPADTRTPMEILHDEERMIRVHKNQLKKKWNKKNKNKIEFQKHLIGWKQDFHNMELRDPWLLRKPKKVPKKNKKSKSRRWWSSVDLHLHQAQRATTSNDKLNQWQRELDRRRAIDKLKSSTLQSYCGKGIVKEQKIRSNRLMRYHQAKVLDQAIRKQEARNIVQNEELKVQLKSMTPLDLRGFAHRTKKNPKNRMKSAKHYTTLRGVEKNENEHTNTMGYIPTEKRWKKKPIGFFTLDSKENIKQAFSILSNGELTIDLPVLMHYLSSMGDPPLDINEQDELRYEISKFALGTKNSQSIHGSLKIDYESFVESMRMMSRKHDASDTTNNAMLKKFALY